MATIRAYTTIEQSKHLVELGFDPSTADMYWYKFDKNKDTEWTVAIRYEPLYDGEIPCWSLAALLESIPFFITIKEEGEPDEYYHFQLNRNGSVFRSKWRASYHGLKTERWKVHTRRIRWAVGPDEESETPLDAVFEMVCWLIEQGYMNLKCCDNEKLY